MTRLQLTQPRRSSESSTCSTESTLTVSEHESPPTCECTPKLHGVGGIFDALVHPVRSSRLSPVRWCTQEEQEEQEVARTLGLDGDLRSFWRQHGEFCLRGRAPEGQELSEELERRYPVGESKLCGAFPALGVSSAKGSKGSRNQDNFCVARLKKSGHSLMAVADGHGTFGHAASAWVVQSLPYHLLRSPHFPSDIRGALEDAFAEVHGALALARVREKFCFSGSTVTVALWSDTDPTVWVAHVGDSRCVICSSGERRGVRASQAPDAGGGSGGARADGAADAEGIATTVLLETTDHSPDVPAEKTRIEESGGEVRTQRQRRVGLAPLEVHRVFAPGAPDCEGPAINLSRSLGDVRAHQLGVSAAPEVTSVRLDPHSRSHIVLASDGVWNGLSSARAAELALRADLVGAQAAALEIRTEAQRVWAERHRGLQLDDATVLLVSRGPRA